MSIKDAMKENENGRPRARALLLLLFACLLPAIAAGCHGAGDGEDQDMKPKRTIAEVLNDYSPELMSVDGVVGVYAGLTDRGAPCLVVMARKETDLIRKKIPAEIEGYPVRLEYGGDIRPMR